MFPVAYSNTLLKKTCSLKQMKYDLPVHNEMGTEDVSYAYAGQKCKQHRDPRFSRVFKQEMRDAT